MEVVVVLPCAPAMAMPNFKRINSANISARGITGITFARAARISGLEFAIAVGADVLAADESDDDSSEADTNVEKADPAKPATDDLDQKADEPTP